MTKSSLLKFILVFAVTLILQITIVPYLQIVNWKPDLLLIVVVIFALQTGPSGGSSAGFFSGLAGDLASSHLLGLGALSRTISGYLAGSMKGKLKERSQFVITLFFAGLVNNLIFYSIATLGKDFSWRLLFFIYIIPNLFYTVLLGLGIYYTLGNWLAVEE